jgi:adenosylcobinamide kinase/adenosylcobinamide-phosphate guanylyltransferase
MPVARGDLPKAWRADPPLAGIRPLQVRIESIYAQELAAKLGKKIVYIATGEGLDKEMEKRIKKHKRTRKTSWKTIEEPKNINKVILNLKGRKISVLIDCLTLLTSNLLLEGLKEREILRKIRDLLKTLKKKKFQAILVSNEVGLGIVPDNKLGRDFRDILGRVNQIVAQAAEEVYFMVSGLPVKVK